MPKLTRKSQKIFGGNSSNNGVFGSAVSGGILDNDPDIIQSPEWEIGWNAATISGEKLPSLEEMQGVEYVATRQIAYLFQEGIPEYDSNTVYFQNSLVKESGTVKLYKSLLDDNAGNPLSDNVSWNLLADMDSLSVKNNYEAIASPLPTDDSSEGYSVGSKWYYSGDIWLCVDSSIGAAVWVDTGVNLDDLGALAFQDSIPVMVGDSGSGGVSGLVPAPSAGAAAADKVLKADGTWGSQQVLQTVYVQNITHSTTTNAIPYDDTIPQISEGLGILEGKITPKSASSRLLVTYKVRGAVSGKTMTAAAFLNGGAGAVDATDTYAAGGTNIAVTFGGEFVIPVADTNEHTINIRIGAEDSTPLAVNGGNSGRRYGGAGKCTLVIMEIA